MRAFRHTWVALGGAALLCCGVVPARAQVADRSPAEAIAAEIKANEAAVSRRIAAVRYLATVDCRYYPDAGDALIDALRNDPSEPVRHEAALALARAGCGEKKIVAALLVAVQGQNADGSPGETSPRVRSAALKALHHCTNRAAPSADVVLAVAKGSAAGSGHIKLSAFYTDHLTGIPRDQLLNQAAHLLEAVEFPEPAAPEPSGGIGGKFMSIGKFFGLVGTEPEPVAPYTSAPAQQRAGPAPVPWPLGGNRPAGKQPPTKRAPLYFKEPPAPSAHTRPAAPPKSADNAAPAGSVAASILNPAPLAGIGSYLSPPPAPLVPEVSATIMEPSPASGPASDPLPPPLPPVVPVAIPGAAP